MARKWTIESVLAFSKTCDTRHQFAMSPAGKAAQRLGTYGACVSCFDRSKKWTLELCLSSAKKYGHYRSWKMGDRAAFAAAKRHGWIDECSTHFKTPCRKKKQANQKIKAHDAHVHSRAKILCLDFSSHVSLWKAFNEKKKARNKWKEQTSTIGGVVYSRMRTRLRQGVKRGLRNPDAKSVTFSRIGYSVQDLVGRLESTMPSDASWSDFMNGRLHIDHIRPLASFDLSDESQIIEAYALSNLQLLWARDNIRKNSMWNGVIVRNKKVLSSN